MKAFQLLLFLMCYSFTTSIAQQSLLQSGPMLGYAEMTEVLLWVQTKEAAEVQFLYWMKDSLPIQKNSTPIQQTIAKNAFTTKTVIADLEPGMQYEYEILINGKQLVFDYPTEFKTQTLWQWRSSPPDFQIAVGSCVYVNEPKYDRPGKGYGGDYYIFESMQQMRPDLMVWLGDNTYFREADWYTRSGMLHRYTHTRSLKEMQAFLASTSHYAIWDDHDYGPNDSDRSFIHKDKSSDVFELFWGNPTFGIPQVEGGMTTQFQWNDVDFFLLDDRYFRSPNECEGCERTILGEAQRDWLIDALTTSKANFKMVSVGGQVLNTADVFETYTRKHKEERDYLLRRIEEEGIKNVIFLSGDRHHTELNKLTDANGNNIYDFTVSPLTSGSGSTRSEANDNRVDGTLTVQRNFGIMEITGARTERKLTFKVFDSKGKELWSRNIEAQ